MKNSNRAFSTSAAQHIYQRSIDHGVIFYSLEDRIVYYTISATKAKIRNVRLAAASIMFTHTHQSLYANSLRDIDGYLHDIGTSFSRAYNCRYGRTGRLVERRPGRSQKKRDKDKRSNLIYVYNNHVEKGLCKSALEERWSFLAYAFSNHPFSEEINIKRISKPLRRFLKLVDRRVERNQPLKYSDLDRIMPMLSNVEQEQFVDYVIKKYSWIDFNLAVKEFKDIQSMLTAVESSTGSEYDINEDYSPDKDWVYLDLVRIAEKNTFIREIYKMTKQEKLKLLNSLNRKTSATKDQLGKFLHFIY